MRTIEEQMRAERSKTWKGEMAMRGLQALAILCISVAYIATVNHIRQVIGR